MMLTLAKTYLGLFEGYQLVLILAILAILIVLMIIKKRQQA